MDIEASAGVGAASVLLLGYGSVGRALAPRVSEAAGTLTIVDPAAGENERGLGILRDLPSSLEGVDLLISAVPADASSACATACAARPGRFLYVDCSSSPRAAVREAAAMFAGREARFVDAAIMGSIDLHRADTPLILAGPSAAEAAGLLSRLGLSVEVLEDSEPGDASALKLLRSVLTKGLEAVAVEAFLAARAMGLEDRLRASLSDVGRSSFPDLLDSMVRTHVAHASRRAHEVAAAIAQIEEHGGDASVSRSVRVLFERTADVVAGGGTAPGGGSADAALAWLERARA